MRERLRRLREYRWSSYRAYAGFERGPKWLTTERVLEMLGAGTEQDRREQYREFVESAAREGTKASSWERLEAGLVLGGPEFVERMRGLASGNEREQTELRRFKRRAEIGKVVALVEGWKGAKWGEFRDEPGDWGRDAVLWLGRTGLRWTYSTSQRAYSSASTSWDLNRPWKRWPLRRWRWLKRTV